MRDWWQRRLAARRARAVSARQLVGLAGLVAFSAGVFSFAHALPPYVARDLLYLLPVGLMAWWFGRAWGVFFATLATGLRLLEFGATLAALSSAQASAQARMMAAWSVGSAIVEYAAAALLIAALRAAHDRERHAARHDELTGLLNRRAFYAACAPWCADRLGRVTAATEVVAHRLSRWRSLFTQRRHRRRPALRGHSGVSLVYLDLDGFKAINDARGHAVGDAVLRAIGAAITRATRTSDLTARLGGDEFAVLLPGAHLAGASRVASRLLDEIRATARAGGWPVDASVGVAVFAMPPASVDALVRAADALMYAVKQSGKGRIAAQVVRAADAAA